MLVLAALLHNVAAGNRIVVRWQPHQPLTAADPRPSPPPGLCMG
jgi:hypothetical protein